MSSLLDKAKDAMASAGDSIKSALGSSSSHDSQHAASHQSSSGSHTSSGSTGGHGTVVGTTGAAPGQNTAVAAHGTVQVQSQLAHESQMSVDVHNQANVTALMKKLGTTHTQVDEYSKKRTEKINAETEQKIKAVVARAQNQQEDLVKQVHAKNDELESKFKAQLQVAVEAINKQKAEALATLETQWNAQQQQILEVAKHEIDLLNQSASEQKIGVLQEGLAQAQAQTGSLTQQLASAQTANTLQGTTTTTITTEASGASQATGSAGGATRVAAHQTSGPGASHTASSSERETHHQSSSSSSSTHHH